MLTFKRVARAILIFAVLSIQVHCAGIFEAPGGLSPFNAAGVPISFNRLQYVYSGKFNQSAKGQPIYSISLLQPQRGFIYLGDLKIKGKVTPTIPGSLIPSKMRLSVRHKNQQNALLRSKNFDFNVGADGTIDLQTFRHRDVIGFATKDVFEVSVISVDTVFPPATANFTFSYVPPPPGT
ncbi:MAG TPA: hypothetical protein VLH08_09990 [Acidobacteriota bacterium]|nr:hypothetical protein [Acidobacteriota bacterium]